MDTTAAQKQFWVPTPPGWVEIAAFDTDARAEAHWRDMIEPAREHLGDGPTDHLYLGLREARAAVARSGVTSAGVVVTEVDDKPAVWTFSTTIEKVASGEVNPVALVERAVGTAGTVERVEDITLVDGRTAVQAFLTLSPETRLGRAHGSATAPAGGTGTPPVERLGSCVVAVALPGRPHDLVLVTGSSPDPEHRPLLAHVVSAIAAGVHVGTEPPEGVARASGVLPVNEPAGT
ncbi:hypothetical protein SAMN05216184_105191 [Georgenia satyanarayanai]|uniref:Uncharacterized protein n=1 Tax=Georgenia satyanarayanai TaxID=860221 RepID=A0A2Y9ABH7_9MICO|nr:hypothetical protein [Georgenia satyanarayanai]PYF99947.1 hypothetical protein A8987_105191 [Georgenia satyanarayanai]SSA41951.1 hypothetical protein SAMN05216184_105191 [Georgenia satyanarayanai]